MHVDYISYGFIACIYMDLASSSYFAGKVRASLQEGALSACYFVTACLSALG